MSNMDTDEFRDKLHRIGDVEEVQTIVPGPFRQSDVLFYMPGVSEHRLNRSEVMHKEVEGQVTDIWVLFGGVRASQHTEEEVEGRMREALSDVEPPDGDPDSYVMKVTDTSDTIAGRVANANPIDGPFSYHFKDIDVLIRDVNHWTDSEFIRFMDEVNQAFFEEFYA